jgi:hypothetical protein
MRHAEGIYFKGKDSHRADLQSYQLDLGQEIAYKIQNIPMWFRLIHRVTGLLQLTAKNNNNSWIYTVYNSLWHMLSLLSLLYLPQFSGHSFQHQMFPFLSIPKLFLCLGHSNSPLTPTELLLSQEDSFYTESLYH